VQTRAQTIICTSAAAGLQSSKTSALPAGPAQATARKVSGLATLSRHPETD